MKILNTVSEEGCRFFACFKTYGLGRYRSNYDGLNGYVYGTLMARFDGVKTRVDSVLELTDTVADNLMSAIDEFFNDNEYDEEIRRVFETANYNLELSISPHSCEVDVFIFEKSDVAGYEAFKKDVEESRVEYEEAMAADMEECEQEQKKLKIVR